MSYETLSTTLAQQVLEISKLLDKEQQLLNEQSYDKWLLFWQHAKMSKLMEELSSIYQQLQLLNIENKQDEVSQLFAQYHAKQQRYRKHEMTRHSILSAYSKLNLNINSALVENLEKY